jgi:hypothetical protein
VGALRITVIAGPIPYVVAVVHLIEGATVEDALTWSAEHPYEEPPMIDRIGVIGEGGLPSPGDIALAAGSNPVACVSDTGDLVLGDVVAVGGDR